MILFCSSHKQLRLHTYDVMFYNNEITSALAARFTDMDEIKDVARHGCAMGVSGFIYYDETTKFFWEHEDSIEDVCYDTLGGDFMSIIAKNTTSVHNMIQVMVWHVVETYCQHVLDQGE